MALAQVARLVTARLRRPRLLAVVHFRDEIRYLPDFLRNVAPQVDGIVALDDGSSDGSAELMAAHPAVLEVLRPAPRQPHSFDETRNRRLLCPAAARHGADWLIGVDADERLEDDFRRRAARAIARAERSGTTALSVIIREIWDDPRTWRADGAWGRKRHARLFRWRPDAVFDPRPLHGHWAPLDSQRDGGFAEADVILYHLRMLRRADRVARRARWEAIDPRHEHQSIGYAHLTDETGLRLEPLPAGRGYRPLATAGEDASTEGPR
ncbi:MAG: glycosyltransferase family 2 protein [Acidobacteriota bacterium]